MLAVVALICSAVGSVLVSAILTGVFAVGAIGMFLQLRLPDGRHARPRRARARNGSSPVVDLRVGDAGLRRSTTRSSPTPARTRTASSGPSPNGLSESTLEVWYDDFSLTVGDSLRGVDRSWPPKLQVPEIVVPEPPFLRQAMARLELGWTRCTTVTAVMPMLILPICGCHNVSHRDVSRTCPRWPTRWRHPSAAGLDDVVARPGLGHSPRWVDPRHSAR